MSEDRAKLHPGTPDINAQFLAGANLRKALTEYKKIKRSNGDYTFGDLTVKYYGLTGAAKTAWEDGVALYPPDVQNEIKRHIIAALTHLDDQGHERPVPLSITWQTQGAASVTCTYNPPNQADPSSSASYSILITGFPAPLPTPLGERGSKY